MSVSRPDRACRPHQSAQTQTGAPHVPVLTSSTASCRAWWRVATASLRSASTSAWRERRCSISSSNWTCPRRTTGRCAGRAGAIPGRLPTPRCSSCCGWQAGTRKAWASASGVRPAAPITRPATSACPGVTASWCSAHAAPARIAGRHPARLPARPGMRRPLLPGRDRR